MNKPADRMLDLSEKGSGGESLDRRLFVQFLGFGGIDPVLESLLVRDLENSSLTAVLYSDINDYKGAGLLTMSEDPEFFVTELRQFLSDSSFAVLKPKPEHTMLGRTYSLGYEKDLERTLISGPMQKIFDPELEWAIWYPLRRAKAFETLTHEEQRAVLGEHGKIGFQFGDAGYARDIRLASHGLDKNDNDFVIGILGKELYPLSALVERMRKTQQTSRYLESLGPFFVGKKLFSTRQAA
jgi:chlorite dismutase